MQRPTSSQPSVPFTPDFFLVGAPKCGTTALAGFLAKHPGVQFSRYKEPHFFCTDLDWRIVKTEREYADLFDIPKKVHAEGQKRLTGEASVFYLMSKDAIKNIETRGTEPRYIVTLRHPAELVCSLYFENRKAGDERHNSSAAAWDGQESFGHRNPAAMRYRDVGRLGEQVERILNQIPRERLHFVFHSDFLKTPRQTYLEILAFLGLPDDGRRQFPIENESHDYHSQTYNRLITGVSDVLGPTFRFRQSFRVVARMLRLFNVKVPLATERQQLGVYAQMVTYFESDIQLLARLLNRNLDEWLER